MFLDVCHCQRVLVLVHKSFKFWELKKHEKMKKMIHKSTNKGESMKHNKTSVFLEKMVEKLNFLRKIIS
jgi:TnpA family transposase